MRFALLAIAAALPLSIAGCGQDRAAPAEPASTSPATAPSAAQADAPAATVAPAAGVSDDAAPDAARAGPMDAPAEPDGHAAVNARIDNVLGDHAPYERAVLAFRAAVQAGDRAAVAAMVAYPFTAHLDRGEVRIADAAAFVARYDDIVTPAIARAIGDQRYADLFVNHRGVMFGNGEAWINGACADAACAHPDVRVVAIQPAQ